MTNVIAQGTKVAKIHNVEITLFNGLKKPLQQKVQETRTQV